jgi:hypothetical protein
LEADRSGEPGTEATKDELDIFESSAKEALAFG